MCYYYNYLFLILSCKGTHSFRTINKLRLIFRTPHAKTLQRYAFVLVPQDPSLQIINNYFSTNSDKPGQPALFHEKIRQASDRESMPAGFTLDGYRNENERLSEEGIDPACRLFETFLQFLVRQFRDNGLSIGGKVRLLARKKRSEQVVHLFTGQDFTRTDGSRLGQRKRQRVTNLLVHFTTGLDRTIDHIPDQRYRIKILHSGRKTVDRIAVVPQVGQIKTDKPHILEQGWQDCRLTGGKLDNLRKKDLLGSTPLLPDVRYVLVEQDTDMGTVLIDQSQTRLQGSYDVFSFILVTGIGDVIEQTARSLPNSHFVGFDGWLGNIRRKKGLGQLRIYPESTCTRGAL